ncbi:MAG TPA: zf-HC2 domain-containing protein [Acidimicrobiales bacterium]|nr:zf-HC2 domain-containing protein [Acidimicrobiales bacterium]
MECSEPNLLAFLVGDLSPDETRAFDGHLLSCAECWTAVQSDRAGRAAAEHLRVHAPQSLADRVVLAVEIAATERADDNNERADLWKRSTGEEQLVHRNRRVRARIAIASLAVAAGLAVGLSLAFVGSVEPEPAQIAAVVALVPAPGHVVKNGTFARNLVIGGQRLSVRSYRVDGVVAIVATSPSEFPMPVSAHLLEGSSQAAWMATHGSLAMYCVNRTAGRTSMLVVAPMPVAELPQIAAQLRLI